MSTRETAALRERYGLFVAGAWIEGKSTFATVEPATERPLADVVLAGDDEIEKAVRGARRGFEKYWRKLRPSERAKHLFRLARAVDERARELAALESLDAGTPIRYARGTDVPQAVATLFHYAGWADKLQWALRPGERARPLGVAVAVAGAAAPVLAAATAIGPALACGNTVILMPSEVTSLAALALAQAALDADVPPGVLTVVTGDARTRSKLADHADVDCIEYSGPRAAGVALARDLAGTPKRTILRLDSAGLILVFDDAPLADTVEGIVGSLFAQRGPFAPTGARLLVQAEVAGPLLDALADRLTRLRHGDPLDERTDVGPLLSRREREAAEAFVRAAVEASARPVQAPWDAVEHGFWHPPTFLADLRPDQEQVRAEPPPSVVPVIPFATLDEALLRAKEMGALSGAGVWTSSLQRAAYVAARLRAPSVWCGGFDRFDPAAPSGAPWTGRGGAGPALREYLNP